MSGSRSDAASVLAGRVGAPELSLVEPPASGHGDPVPFVLSVSRITAYLQCALRYRFRYVDQLPPAFKPVALAFGAAVHSAIAFWHEERLAGQEIGIERVLRVFRADWAAQKAAPEPIRFDDHEDEADLLSKGEALIRLFVERFAEVEVRAVEQAFDVELMDPETGEVAVLSDGTVLRLHGFLDLILADDTVVELKTAARMPDPEMIGRQVQVSGYSLAYRLARDRDPKLAFVYLLKTKTPRLEVVPTNRTIAEQAWFVGLAREVAGGIGAGVFPPNPGWACAGCEYRAACGGWRSS